MTIRPQWLKDICSILFSIYYIIYATEADEKVRVLCFSLVLQGAPLMVLFIPVTQLRRFRAVPTVEMLRTCWEKTTNPYVRMSIIHCYTLSHFADSIGLDTGDHFLTQSYDTEKADASSSTRCYIPQTRDGLAILRTSRASPQPRN